MELNYTLLLTKKIKEDDQIALYKCWIDESDKKAEGLIIEIQKNIFEKSLNYKNREFTLASKGYISGEIKLISLSNKYRKRGKIRLDYDISFLAADIIEFYLTNKIIPDSTLSKDLNCRVDLSLLDKIEDDNLKN